MKLKRDKLDIVFSKLVRERAGWHCEHSGRYFPEGRGRMGLHCSHLFGRRHLATRWHPDNAFSHSFASHQYLGENPVLFYDWAKDKLGTEQFKVVRELAMQPVKMTKADKEELYQHFKSELADMHKKRMDGETGRIDFINPFFQ